MGVGEARGALWGLRRENVWGEKGKRGALWGLQAFIWGLGKQLPLPACTAKQHGLGWSPARSDWLRISSPQRLLIGRAARLGRKRRD